MPRRRRRRYNYFGDPVRQPAPKPTKARLQARLGRTPTPVCGEGRKLAKTFWGLAWCRNLEHYQDYSNRLPRGRTYLRQGKVLDVDITRGRITGLVLGSSIYEQQIEIAAVDQERWDAIRGRCTGKLSSAIELLEGRLPDEVMSAVTKPGSGLFPAPREIRMRCSCPDWASMCKHLAALLYGVGLRLDARPELLFTLRGVSHDELVGGAGLASPSSDARRIPAAELAEIFGVLIDDQLTSRAKPAKKSAAKKSSSKKSAAKKSSSKKSAAKKSSSKKSAAKKSSSKKSTPSKPVPPRFPNNRKWISMTELAAYGLSPTEIQEWVQDGHLLAVEGHKDYRVLQEARRRLRKLPSDATRD